MSQEKKYTRGDAIELLRKVALVIDMIAPFHREQATSAALIVMGHQWKLFSHNGNSKIFKQSYGEVRRLYKVLEATRNSVIVP